MSHPDKHKKGLYLNSFLALLTFYSKKILQANLQKAFGGSLSLK